ncbi:ribosomal RNA small subunit methyltransferase E [Candidatus Kinetoplastibacterium blastocrithidii TCC012E]|uniref:Ribosomal RNA small subunit methyltransferase E n=1 Tax=Candidatus Kinetoplastidibacterium blastocrithidiae TCC012E TaxID=1208922 RepID=M1LZS9_9PROT|nr:16S rRNA (uracil(1498)-N(3))-methyltransferase [Candidatus Kinetoplastibacterium blastocrithidii]AFZ83475.1 16S rRNA (uracil1498-N3)-methyltransferase [Candidatus Kinetoplastibacterium blastocrithidii (ex Strigomonas culicis)]AGF49571.1 ribosomal RNA small subunit methyltransferase E [Candidatus Kinetoplastibacterium blastocrithidii TCC012E]
MQLSRFFCDINLHISEIIQLPDGVMRHIKALRLAHGDDILLFNGLGGEYLSRLIISNKIFFADIREHIEKELELLGNITLVQAITSKNKMDFIIEKSTELGVRRIVPIQTQRCNNNITHKNLSHWRRVVIAASEQCGRNLLAEIDEHVCMSRYMSRPKEDPHIICDPLSKDNIFDVIEKIKDTKSLTIMIGPEGGWSKKELNLAAHSNNIYPMNFGARILRTETAGIAIISAVSSMMHWNI